MQLTAGALVAAGYSANFWSTTAYPALAAYAFDPYFNSANFYLSSRAERWYGLTVRGRNKIW